jgi:hypothetical protein
MGLMTAMAIGELEMTMEDQIGIHLRSNFYPPIPLSMVQPCVDAINAYWNEDIYAEIDIALKKVSVSVVPNLVQNQLENQRNENG